MIKILIFGLFVLGTKSCELSKEEKEQLNSARRAIERAYTDVGRLVRESRDFATMAHNARKDARKNMDKNPTEENKLWFERLAEGVRKIHRLADKIYDEASKIETAKREMEKCLDRKDLIMCRELANSAKVALEEAKKYRKEIGGAYRNAYTQTDLGIAELADKPIQKPSGKAIEWADKFGVKKRAQRQIVLPKMSNFIKTETQEDTDFEGPPATESLETRMDKLAKRQNEFAAQAFRFFVPRLQFNRMDHTTCHPELGIAEPFFLVKNFGKTDDYRTARAKKCLPNTGIVYFEVEIVILRGCLNIGLAAGQVKIAECVGNYPRSVSWDNYGVIWGHTKKFGGVQTFGEKFRYGKGDVVGYGIKWQTREVILTKNGEKLDASGLFVNHCDLYPTISLFGPEDTVRVNFGPDFKFNLEGEFWNES